MKATTFFMVLVLPRKILYEKYEVYKYVVKKSTIKALLERINR